MTPVVLTDLDDTIFTTEKGYPNTDLSSLLRVTTAKNGNHSYMCEKRRAFFDWMLAGATVIPVTARSRDAFSRVHIESFKDGAILSNGAVVLQPNGEVDPVWQERHVETFARFSVVGAKIAAMVENGEQFRVLRHAYGSGMMGLSIKGNTEDYALAESWLESLSGAIADGFYNQGINMAVNGNNLAITPVEVSKRKATEYILEARPELAGRPLIGAGDSISDLGFMALCDMMLVPVPSQISATMSLEGRGNGGA